MYAFFEGEIDEKGPEYVVLNVRDIGYLIKISTGTASYLPQIGERIRLYTYTSVREDDISLYGFLSKEELEFFKLLISVNGVGPKAGQNILSALTPDALRFAVFSGDAKTISKAPGIGAKIAQRIILDLKDKISIEDTLPHGFDEYPASHVPVTTAASQDAIEALVALGYSATDATKAVSKVEQTESMDSEAILKAALKFMFA
ncbi:MAG: Holliday junction branch migration protein RuvA [Lachnospiraceae bacterium]|nr:Holliday junction branch migration protein RuvA [Lachnospiraceae bacterium]